jgi:hypothetical protein
MTFGGVWALLPDVPSMLHNATGFSSGIASAQFGDQLHSFGNLFFFHSLLDASAHEHALMGAVLILLLYHVAIALLMMLERRARLGMDEPGFRRRDAMRRKYSLARSGSGGGADGSPYDTPISHRVRSSHLARSA